MNPNDTPPYQQPTQPQQPIPPSPFPTDPSVPPTGNIPHVQYNPTTPEIEKGMFNGRLNRIGYLLSLVYVLIYSLISEALIFLLKGNKAINILAISLAVVLIALTIPVSISVMIRRWHDMNKSGWYLLLGLIPFVGTLLLFVYLFVPGTETANDYGAVDDRPSTLSKVLFGK